MVSRQLAISTVPSRNQPPLTCIPTSRTAAGIWTPQVHKRAFQPIACGQTCTHVGLLGNGNNYSLDIFFNKFDTEDGYDFGYVTDSSLKSINYPYSLTATGTTSVQPVHLYSGGGRVGFTSDLSIVRTGLSFSYNISMIPLPQEIPPSLMPFSLVTKAMCPGSCNNGTCMSGSCVCNYGYTGLLCDQRKQPRELQLFNMCVIIFSLSLIIIMFPPWSCSHLPYGLQQCFGLGYM